MKKFIRIVSILLCLAMLLSYVPAVFAEDVQEFVLVNSVSELSVGDKIIIVANDAAIALGTTQRSNNRAGVSVTVEGDRVIASEYTQIITLGAGTKEGTFSFFTGAGYLYAASSTKNYLRTEETLSDNSSWLITIASNGGCFIVAQGDNTRATLQYNPNNGTPIFGCYSSTTQGQVSVYKLASDGNEEPSEPTNELILGNNELYSAGGVSGEYTYVAQQSGTLHVTVRYYKSYDNDFGEGMLTMPSWSQLLINGEAITSFRQTLDVTEGDEIDFVLTSDGDEYTLGLNLSYEGFYEEPLGSELNPVRLSVMDCPTESIVIPAGGTVWYELDDDFFYGDYCLVVKGDDAYVYCDNTDALAFNVTDFYYYAESGKVTFWVYENLIQIGNTGESEAVFTLDAYDFDNSMDMTKGDNTFWLPRNTNGMYLYWTAQEADDVTVKITGDNWLYYAGVMNDPEEELPGEAHWSVEGASNEVTFPVEAGDLICVYITTIDADGCNPGGTLNVKLSCAADGTDTPENAERYVISWGDFTFQALGEKKSYGYAPAGSNHFLDLSELDAITFTDIGDGKFTMTDCYGRYIYIKADYNSFNVATDVTEGHEWTLVDAGDGTYYIKNVLKDKYIAYNQRYGNWECVPFERIGVSGNLTVTPYEEHHWQQIGHADATEEADGMDDYICEICMEQVEIILHYWLDATCEKPIHCANCDATHGDPLEHDYDFSFILSDRCDVNDSICFTCKRCGHSYTELTDESFTDHAYDNGVCGTCGHVFGVISSGYWTMSLDSVIYLNYYPTLTDFEDCFDFGSNGGVVVWVGETAPTSRYDLYVGAENCITLPMLQNEKGEWYVRTPEIFAKNLGDKIYIRPYVLIDEHNQVYLYQNGAPNYCAANYCYDILNNLNEREDTRNVCAALLTYAAAAQIYFDYKTDSLVTDVPSKWPNVDLSMYELAYNEAYIDALPTTSNVDQHIKDLAATLEGQRVSVKHEPDTLDLQGAIRLTVRYSMANVNIDWNEVASANVLFWNEDTMSSLDMLTVDNANYVGELVYDAEEGIYKAMSDYILAKNLGKVVYFSVRIEMYDGTIYRSGLNWYSPEAFVADSIAGESGAIDVCKAIAVYSEMAKNRFCYTEGLEYEVNEDGTTCTITGIGTYKNLDVIIPESIEGYMVTAIGDYAFAMCADLTSVTIPDTVTSIGEGSFSACYALTSITIGSGVTSVGADAFMACYNLPSITLPDNITSIGQYAFSYCPSLSSVTIGNGITNITRGLFYDCGKLTTVIFGEGVTAIEYSAFCSCSNLTSVTIPDSVTSIGEYAFYSCDGLSSVTIGNGIISIGDYAFGYCTSLIKIVFEGDAPAIGVEAFYVANANAYYPADNETWTADVMQNYGGTITWVALGGPNCDNGHSYEAVVTAPTCTDEGYTTYICSVCGDSYVTDYVPAKCAPWVIVTAPTFEAPGEAHKSCAGCGANETKILDQKDSEISDDLNSSFQYALDWLDYFHNLNAYYMISVTSDYFLWYFDYEDVVCVSAAEYEAVLNMYFAVDDAMLNAIRQSSEEGAWSWFYYDDVAQTYTIRMGGGMGGSLPPREFLGFVQNGDTYEVYYAEIQYAYLQDALPEGVNEWEYAEELGWPWFIEYEGVVYEEGPEGYVAILGHLDQGRKYTVKLGEYVVQIISCVEYTQEDLPEQLIVAGGFTGENLLWTLTDDGVFTVSGNGAMDDYDNPEGIGGLTPWRNYQDRIYSVVIGDGVTYIGNKAFTDVWNLSTLTMADTVTEIGNEAFMLTALREVRLSANLQTIGAGAFNGCFELTEIVFTGDAPVFADTVFYGVVATAYYPADNDTWTDDVLQNYGGEISWIADEMSQP